MTNDEQTWAREKAAFVIPDNDGSGRDRSADPAGPGPLARQFAQLARHLLAADTVVDVLEQIVGAAYHIVPGADLVSVTLRSADGTFHTPVETDPTATKLDQLQYDSGEGPCMDVAHPVGPDFVCCNDLGNAAAWPTFGPAASGAGFAAVLSTVLLPATDPPQLSGALNIYARQPGTFDQEAQTTALLLATHASLALAGTEAVTRAQLREAQLERALVTRDVIGQAKGILMNRRGITADEAFDLLRRASQHLNVKLTALAETLTTRNSELDPPE